MWSASIGILLGCAGLMATEASCNDATATPTDTPTTASVPAVPEEGAWAVIPLIGLEYDLELGLGGNAALLVGRRKKAGRLGAYTCRGVECSVEIYDRVQSLTIGYTDKAVSKFGFSSHSLRLGALRAAGGTLFDDEERSRNYTTLIGEVQILLPFLRARVITNGRMDRTLVTGGLLFKF